MMNSSARQGRRLRNFAADEGGEPSAAWIAADIMRFEDGKLAEHWDVLQDEASAAESASGLPMFGDRFPA
jgi:predicted SnoaL-like aldol condensation-catalyzing enzyme